jgi:hypothetical protein
MKGIYQSKGEIILLLDADLAGLKVHHLEEILKPVLENRAHMCLSRREIFSFFDVVSGERAFIRKQYEPFFKLENPQRNALEIMMNDFSIRQELEVASAKWKGVRQTYKSFKFGYFKGLWLDIAQVLDWMKQLGRARFSFIYLIFWLKMIGFYKPITGSLQKLYQSIYSDKMPFIREIKDG